MSMMVSQLQSRKLLRIGMLILGFVLCDGALAQQAGASGSAASMWKMGEPITTYWSGPPMTDAVATQMSKGGWNLVWCREDTLDVAQRHGLRAYLVDALLKPASLDDEKSRAKLDALIARVKDHPALYAYHLKDEPSASMFPGLARLIRYVRERDPRHAVYINLYPTYAKKRQLGVSGGEVAAYKEYVQKFIEIVKPDLLSYDYYNFMKDGDRDQYFLNLALIRQAAVGAGLPFMNIVQASAWRDSWRIPTGDELRWLAYTSLAYGAQGISYFVYRAPGKYKGGMASADGTPTALYPVASKVNREFVAVASQLQGLRSFGAFHVGMLPPGTSGLPHDVAIGPEASLGVIPFKSGHPVEGVLLGYFGESGNASAADASHMLIVNLDYKHPRSIKLAAHESLSVFDAEARNWKRIGNNHIELRLPAGGGRLLRIDP